MYKYLKSSSLKSWLLTIFSALVLTISMPGYSLSPIAFIALVPLFYATKIDNRNLYLKILLFSLIFYVLSLRWLITTISFYGAAPTYISLIILFIFALYLSLYWLLFFYFYKKVEHKIVLSTIFIILEIIRGSFISGFPWLNLAQSQYNNIYILKMTSIFGEYGLSFIIFITNLFIADYFFKRQLRSLCIGIAIPLLAMFLGYILITFNGSVEKSFNARIIQPVYDQRLKWDEESARMIINHNKELINNAIAEDADLLVLPEAVFPVFLEFNEDLYYYLLDSSYKIPILFGNIRIDTVNNRYYNSIFFINNGNIEIYDKIHLVPFGEYFPLQKIFKPIKYYFFGDSEAFSKGQSIRIFQLKDYDFASLVCYEGAFTGLVQRFIKENPNFLVINTNDTWFGDSIGRFQHLSIAVLRAAETSKFVLRAAQSGISACIDPNGRLLNYLDINEEGFIDCAITQSRFTSVFNKLQYSWLVLLIIVIACYYAKIALNKKNIAKNAN